MLMKKSKSSAFAYHKDADKSVLLYSKRRKFDNRSESMDLRA